LIEGTKEKNVNLGGGTFITWLVLMMIIYYILETSADQD